MPVHRPFDPAALAGQLASLSEGSVLCLHQAELGAAGALPAGYLLLLGRLGWLQVLRQRVPACSEHDCPLVTRCPYVADFAPGEQVKSVRPKGGRKFRVTAKTREFVAHPALLAEALPAHPAVRWLADRFRAQAQWTPFALAEAWLAAALAAAGGVGDQPDPATDGIRPDPLGPDYDGSRRELAACIALLAGLGWLAWEDDGRILRLARPWW
jgi:hypothetical protein